MDGAPKGNYDVELVMSQYKSCSVFKRYYVPLLTKLPEELKVRCCSSFVFFLEGGGGCRGGLLCEKIGDTEKFKYTSRGCHHFGNNRAFALAKV